MFQRSFDRLALSRNLFAQGLAIDSLRLMLARLGGQLLGMAFVVLIARHFGESGLGQWAWISGLILVANVFTTLGTDTLIMRETAQSRSISASSLIPAFWLQTLLSVLGVASVWLFSGVINHPAPQALAALRVYSLALFPLAVYTVFSAGLRGRQRLDLFLFLSLFTPVTQILGIWWVIRSNGGIVTLAGALLVFQALAALLAVWLGFQAEPGLRLNWRIAIDEMVFAAQRAWRLAALALLAILQQRLGIILLVFLAGDAQTGWFSAAFRLVEAVKILHFSVLGALFPRMVAAGGGHLNGYAQEDLSISPRKGWVSWRPQELSTNQPALVFLMLFGVAFLAASGLTLAARPLVQLLYGPGFDPAAQALVILAWSLLPYTYSSQVSLHWVTSGRESSVLRISAAALTLTFSLFLGLVPRYGLAGAAWAMLAGESLQALLFFLGSRRRPAQTAKLPGQPASTQEAAVPPHTLQESLADQYALNAAEVLDERRRRGGLEDSVAPTGVILCYLRDPRGSFLHGRRFVRAGGFSADLYLLQGGKQPVGLAANFGVGAPAAVALLEEMVAWGVQNFISIGWAGGLQRGMHAGDLVVVERAIRDEGVSRHYQPTSIYAYPSPELTEQLQLALSRSGHRFTTGSIWTMDAPYRETVQEIGAHQKEGVKTVEMEAAALFAAGASLGVAVGAAVCVADTLGDGRWRLDFNSAKAENGLKHLFAAALAVLSD